MAENNLNWHSERQTKGKQPAVFGVEAIELLSTQLEAMNKNIETLAATCQPSAMECELCGGPHSYATCPYQNANSANAETVNCLCSIPTVTIR